MRLSLMLSLTIWSTSSAFIPSAPRGGYFAYHQPGQLYTQGLKSLPTPEFHGMDIQDIQSSLSYIVSSSSTILSDAAAASSDDGLWNQYLIGFKSILIGVHSTIDQPLRSIGWEQTWGPSIFLFTAGIRSLLLPLSVQQTKGSEYMKALKPYQDEIKAKFKDNQDMINRATAKLFEDANQNPLSGCLISILQLPIFLGLYRSITLLAKDGSLQEPFLWIPSLEGPVSAPDYRGMEWLTQGWITDNGFPTPSLGWETTLAYMVMPIVLVMGQAITMNILTPPPDENMPAEEKEQFEKTQGVLKFLPLLIGFFSLQVPSGLTIYWFTSNLFTVSQSVAVRQYYKMNPPNIELPEYWDALDDVASMTPEERREAAKAGMAVGPKWEDLVDEAKFHYVVERTPLRENSAAWERVQAHNINIPPEMSDWVENKIKVDGVKDDEGIRKEVEAVQV